MKTFLKIFIVVIIVIGFSGCGITFTARKVYDKSEIYSKEDKMGLDPCSQRRRKLGI